MVGQRQLLELTEPYLKSLVAEVSSLPADFDSAAPFGELGMDSFHALKVIKKLEEGFGKLPKTLLFENFNINDLARYFVTHHDQKLRVKFSVAPEVTASSAAMPARKVVTPETAAPAAECAATKRPLVLLENEAYAHPELGPVLRELFERYKNESSVSRGTRNIAPRLFIGSDRRAFFNFSRHKNILLTYGYTGPEDHFGVLADEVYRYSIEHGLQLNVLVDDALDCVGGAPFTATPFGAIQRVRDLKNFTLEGGAMRRLRYQVSKFRQAGECRTEEYRLGTSPAIDRNIVEIIDQWCEGRAKVNPLVPIAREEILAGAFTQQHRLFLTYIGEALQNVILISPLSAAANGYLMDLEFYPRTMPLGGLEFAIANIIETLVAEGCDMLSLGATLGPKLQPAANPDPGVDRMLDELRQQGIFDDQGNLQFKNKFRPENKSIFLCRPAGCADPDNVIDIIMMIADPPPVSSTSEAPMVGEARPTQVITRPTHVITRPTQVITRPAQFIEGMERSVRLAHAGYNVLHLPHEHVEFDLKSDSWSELSLPAIDARMKALCGRLQQPLDVEETLRTVFPFAHFVLTDSGRSAEHLFYGACARKGVVLQNLLFPSAIFHQIDKGYVGRELPCRAAFELQSPELYKGDLDWQQLEQEILRDAGSIAFVCVEVGNNAVGGCPVSMQNLRRARELLSKHSIPLVIDATRIVENAVFITQREAEYSGKNAWDVVREIMSLADTIVASLKKDFCVNKGGIVATNDAALFDELQRRVDEEGAGLDTFDQKVIALSLQNKQQLHQDVLRRMESVERLGRALQARGVPVAQPSGGHCVLIDVKQIEPFRGFEHPAASFAAWVYLNTGVRVAPHNAGMQKGTSLNELVRAAVPVGLERESMDAIIEKFTLLFQARHNVPEIEASSEHPGALGRYEIKEYHNATGRIAVGLPAFDDSQERTPNPVASAAASSSPRERDESPHHGNKGNSRTSLDIAIIGMSGRYPHAKNLNELWANLAAGKDCLEEIPAHRLQRRWQHETLSKYRGGFVADVDKFDSLFFNISPLEAQMLDPQERLFLETAWEAVEDAGYFPELLSESTQRNVGVFVGAVWAMYQTIGVEQRMVARKVNPNSFFWSIANRVSYWMNFSGPSLTLDTACSSSLTAIYLACEALRTGECAAAIAGGVNLDLHQSKLDINSAGGALSPDGVCRTFGRGANGYVAGEGVGAILLKPLQDAIRDKDHIYGVIKGVAVNHGGRSSGYAVPNPKSQASLIASALERAGVDARTVGYIEAHGTGTELGDPIEMAGLTEAFRAYEVGAQACAIGSIKSNIGHLEAAAGVVGVSKVLLQMKHRQLAPSLHSAELNPHIDFENSPFHVQQRLEPWHRKQVDGVEYPRRAGISSFGAGGSNAHVIVEEYQSDHEAAAEQVEQAFPLSARNEAQLREQALRLREHLRCEPNLDDVAYTLQVGRKSFEYRAAIIAGTREELVERLTAFIDGARNANIFSGNASEAKGITRLLDRQEKEEFFSLLSQRQDCRKLSQLWVGGLMEDWQGFRDRPGVRRVPLPTYPFADKRHWACDPPMASATLVSSRVGVHPLIDSNESTFDRQLFNKTFDQRQFFIHDHLVSNIPTLPGVAYLELARKAGELAAGARVRRIRNIVWVSPITVRDSSPTAAVVELKPSADAIQFEVFAAGENGRKQLFSQGKLVYETAQEAGAGPEKIDLQAIRARCAKVIDGKDAYPLFRSLGLHLGPSFQVLREVFKGDSEVLGTLEIPEVRAGDFDDFVLHPSLVDGSFQAGMAAQLAVGGGGEMFVPYSIGEVEVLQPLQRHCYSYITEARGDDKGTSRLTRSNVLIVAEDGTILVRIRESVGVPLLNVHEKSARSDDTDNFAKLYYTHVWERAPLPAARQEDFRSILFFDTSEALRDLYLARIAYAEAYGQQVILVRPGERFEALDDANYIIDSREPGDYVRLFDALVRRGAKVGDICFNLPAVESSSDADIYGADALKDALASGVHSLLRLCQAVIAAKLESKARILCLSAGRAAQPHVEAINGFAKALQLEHPKLGWKTLEILRPGATLAEASATEASPIEALPAERAPAEASTASASSVQASPAHASYGEILDLVLAELSADARDSMVVRYDQGQRHVRKLQKVELTDRSTADALSPDTAELKKGGIYLITGGAGGLGLIFAEFLARQYSARLVLSGRSELSAEGEARLQEIRNLGADVTYIRADVGNREDAHGLIEQTTSRFGGIDGIIHAAGVLRDSYIRNKTAQEMDAVFGPKVFGTVHLDEASKDEKLDFFAMFSSLAAVAGNVGQCDYAFANHFMDCFAQQREALRASGKRSGRSLSVNWSLWADGGMKIDEQTELFFKKNLGIKPLSKVAGLEAFVQGLRRHEPQLAFVEGVQDKVERAWGLRKDEPASPVATAASAPSAAPAANSSPTPSTPAAARGGDGELLLAVQDQLSRIVMDFLKIDAADLSLDKILLDLGFDSIGLATYANLINEKYRLDLTPVLFFEYPSIKEVARHLVADHKAALLQVHGASGTDAAPSAAPVKTSRDSSVEAPEERTFKFNKGRDFAALAPVDDASPRQPVSFQSRFAHQPIAIVGMSGAMPQSEDLEEFWDNLRAARDLITVIPRDRWNWEDYYGDPFKEVNKSNSKWGGFMKEVDKFDPLFFGISPREAELMDPQQRVFLQTVWQAIEDSGHKVSDLAGTKTGLFVGVATNDYVDLMTHYKVPVHAYTSTGNSHSVLVNRVSFLLDLRGPSAPIDTACSSSLIALHRAVESIHTGSSEMAIVGGVQVMTSPAGYIAFGQAGMLADDGRCKTFDRRANGYVRGEGVGAIFLKPLSMAEADGDHIYAVIKSTAENHGGKAAALTAPNPNAQAELLIEAYEKAQIDPATVGYIECHGTGTSLGDPIEIQALKKAFGDLYRKHDLSPPATPHCGLSSAKTNIGHLETAAGIAGVLKALLAIKHRQIPALVHFEEINPYINLKGSPFYIVDRTRHWDAPLASDGKELPRRAGVSSFGFGGANAHVVLEEYAPADDGSLAPANEPQLVVLSARNEDRLIAYARSLLAHSERYEVNLRDLAFTLQVGRDAMPERLALLVTSAEQLREKLRAYVDGTQNIEGVYRGSATGRNASVNAILKDEDVRGTIIGQCLARRKWPKLLELWVNGLDVDWNRLYDQARPRRISLPTYPFAKQRYWIDTSTPSASTERGELLAVPEWQASAIPVASDLDVADFEKRLVVLCEIGHISVEQLLSVLPGSQCRAIESTEQTGIAQRFTHAATECFELIKKVLTDESPVKSLVQIVVPANGEHATFAALAGLVRTAMSESRWLSGQIVLVEPDVTLDQLALRLEQEKRRPQDLLVKYQRGSREVLTWKCIDATWQNGGPRRDPTVAFKEHGVYLISGGFGALGALLAKEILQQTKSARVVLTGRSEIADAGKAILDRFGAGAGRVAYRRADIADAAQVEQLISGIVGDYQRLNGIIHCAGVVAHTMLSNKTTEEIGKVLAPKVAGTVNLDVASRAVDLDFLVLFSSISGAIASPGLGDYAMANAFMDEYATYRNDLVRAGQRRGHTVSIDWPLWKEGAMGTGAAGEELMKQLTGMQPLQPATGLRAFYRSLELPESRTLVMEGEAERIKHFFQVNLQGLRSSAVATLRPTVPKRPALRSVPITNGAGRPSRSPVDARVSILVSRLKADLQAFQRGRH